MYPNRIGYAMDVNCMNNILFLNLYSGYEGDYFIILNISVYVFNITESKKRSLYQIKHSIVFRLKHM